MHTGPLPFSFFLSRRAAGETVGRRARLVGLGVSFVGQAGGLRVPCPRQGSGPAGGGAQQRTSFARG